MDGPLNHPLGSCQSCQWCAALCNNQINKRNKSNQQSFLHVRNSFNTVHKCSPTERVVTRTHFPAQQDGFSSFVSQKEHNITQLPCIFINNFHMHARINRLQSVGMNHPSTCISIYSRMEEFSQVFLRATTKVDFDRLYDRSMREGNHHLDSL